MNPTLHRWSAPRRRVERTLVVMLLALVGTSAWSQPGPIPFGVAVSSANNVEWPARGAVISMYQTKYLSDVVAFFIPWADNETGLPNTCADFAEPIAFARRLGMQVLIQHEQFVGKVSVIPVSIGTSFTEDAVRVALAQEMECFAALEPEYLSVTNELNLIRLLYPADWEVFNNPLYEQLYATIKSVAPATAVGVSYAYITLARTNSWVAHDLLSGPQDFVAFTMLLGVISTNLDFPRPASVPADYFDLIRARLGPQTRVLFTEYTWSSWFEGAEAHQVEWLDRLPALLAGVNPELVVWTSLHDTDNSALGQHGSAAAFSGLRTFEGARKPAWDRVLELMALGALQRFPAH